MSTRHGDTRRVDAQTPPGWYADGSPGFLRWWDGSRWTDQRASRPHGSAAGPGWYPESVGWLRWWDGSRWTHHRCLSGAHSGAAPGWYAVGDGSQLWWDGGRWVSPPVSATAHVQDNPHVPDPPARPVVAVDESVDTDEPNGKAIGIALAAMAVASVVSGLSSRRSEKKVRSMSNLQLLAEIARLGGGGDEWNGVARDSCPECDSDDVVHIMEEDDWGRNARDNAPSWVEFEIGYVSDNRRCDECDYQWTEY